MIRPPAVVGRFYSADPKQLAADVDQYVDSAAEKIPALGCVVPHAGYVFSGHVAGAVYSALQIPARCILIGPRHYPRGESMAILTEGSWQTPFGQAQIDSTLAAELAQAYPRLREDAVAHQAEHSLEVQLPFLQRLVPGFRFVPIVLGTDRYPPLEELGHAMAGVIKAQKEPVLIIASSDMNHYERDSLTRVKDHRAIIQIAELNPRGLYDTVRSDGITMCGYAATVVMLVAALDLGAKKARLIRYATSGDISGDRDQVVGYAGIVVT